MRGLVGKWACGVLTAGFAVLLVAARANADAPTACCFEPTGPLTDRQPTSQPANGVIVLDFEGLNNLESVNNFYNGGTGGNGSGPGQDFGIAFNASSLALIDQDAGGSGNIGGEPSPDTVLVFLENTVIMNVPAGFTTGFSFFYSAVSFPGAVRVYDGLDGTGNLLTQLVLPLTPFNGAPDPTGQFSPFVPIGVSFTGVARSVQFGDIANRIVYDDITIGSAIPGRGGVAPAPVTSGQALLALTAVLGALGVVRLRTRQAR